MENQENPQEAKKPAPEQAQPAAANPPEAKAPSPKPPEPKHTDQKKQIKEVEKKIFSTFADVASSIGYSPLHGQIIGALMVNNRPLSLQEVARETGYSVSMVSLSLDLLEVLGIIKKVKKVADRKLYIELTGDLLGALKNAITTKVSKSISESLAEFQEGKNALQSIRGEESKRVLSSIETLESEIKRLKTYMDLLSKTSLP